MRWILMFGLASLVSTIARAEVLYDDAAVVDATPIFETVRIAEPREFCHEERVPIRGGPRHRRQHVSFTVPIIGGIVGGAIGNAVSHGKTRKRVGTIVGAVLGASLARDVARGRREDTRGHRADARPRGRVRYRTEEICEVRQEFRTEERLVGYQVTYEYGGERFITRTDEHPGESLLVKVRVTPA